MGYLWVFLLGLIGSVWLPQEAMSTPSVSSISRGETGRQDHHNLTLSVTSSTNLDSQLTSTMNPATATTTTTTAATTATANIPKSNILGREICTRGPASWCQDIKIAVECNGVDLCIMSIWKDALFPEGYASACQTCKEVVTEAREKISKNETQEVILRTLEFLCGTIPQGIVALECRTLLDMHFSEVMKILVSHMDPIAVCSVLKLCSSASSKLTSQSETQPSTMKGIQSPVDDEGEMDLGDEMAVMQLAVLLEQDYYLDKVFRSNSKDSNPAINLDVDKNTDAVDRTSVGSLSDRTGDIGGLCVMCEFAISKLDDRLRDNSTENEIRTALEKACYYLPIQSRKPCKQFLDEYTTLILMTLADFLPPQELCRTIRLCRDSNLETNANEFFAFIQFQKVDMSDVEMLPTPQSTSVVTPLTIDSDDCQLCLILTDVMSQMVALNRNSSTATEIEEPSTKDIATTICPNLPSVYLSECNEMTQLYGLYLFSILNIIPGEPTESYKQMACSGMGLCPSN